MIPDYVASALANHLWQSTAVAGLAGILAFVLRRNQAKTRHWLWLVASVKFLIPFSLLVAAGSYLSSSTASVPIAQPKVSAVLERMTQPFSQTSFASVPSYVYATPALASSSNYLDLLPMALFILWACGFLTVVILWWRRWQTVQAAVRMATLLKPIGDIPVMSSPSMLEPGVFGIVDPVLFLPEGIVERLTPPQLSAIIAHEMCHVRRRDNLTAAIHMLVEAAFWFHPVVWWLGARVFEERERACDEAVLQSGNPAQVYAEGILNVCRLYVESPVACVSGVTGSDLKKRIVRIVTERVVHKLDFSRKLLLGAAGLFAIAVPLAFGLVQANQSPTPASGNDITGNWQGTLQAGKDLRTIIKISKADAGWKAVFYSIDQTPQPLPASTATLQGGTFKFEIPMIDGHYEGKLNTDGVSMTGTFTQGGHALPLNLVRATPDTAWALPERPKAMAADANPSFEVATIKPSKPDTPGKMFRVNGRSFSTLNTSLTDLITFSYGLHPKQIIGGPAGLLSDKYDLAGQPDAEGTPNEKQLRAMVQKLLTDRFKLAFHHDQKELSVYALVVGKNGPQMTKSEGDPNGLPSLFFRGLGDLNVLNANMGNFARLMQEAVLDRPVVDKTGLTDRFNFELKWTPDETQFASMGARVPPPTDTPNAPPGLFTAIQEEIGLKLDATKAPVDVIVIDHIEKPSEN